MTDFLLKRQVVNLMADRRERTIDDIVNALRLKRSTVVVALKALRDDGLIVKDRRRADLWRKTK